MPRSTGVSTVAIVVLLASILILGLGLLTAGFALVMPQVPPRAGAPPIRPAAVLLVGSLMYIVPGVWGVVSGIGLWRLKNWARISTIVFAALAGLGGVMILVLALVLFTVPVPPSSDQLDPAAASRVLTAVRAVTMVLSGVLMGVSVWFAILLTRPQVVQQFTGVIDGTAATDRRRPLSITIIAVLMLIGAPLMCFTMLVRAPVPLFLTILAGRAATVYTLIIAGTLTFCGLGLLRLNQAARFVAIGYFVFAILNSATFFLAPGHDARMTALIARQPQLFVPRPRAEAPDLPPTQGLIVFGLVAGLIGAAVPLYFLIARGAAFEPPPADPIWPDAPG